MPFEWGSKNEDVAGWPPIIECMFPPNVRGLLAQLDMAEGGVGLWPCSSFGLGGGVTRTSGTESGLAAFAVDKGGVLSGEREGRGPEDVDDGDGAAEFSKLSLVCRCGVRLAGGGGIDLGICPLERGALVVGNSNPDANSRRAVGSAEVAFITGSTKYNGQASYNMHGMKTRLPGALTVLPASSLPFVAANLNPTR